MDVEQEDTILSNIYEQNVRSMKRFNMFSNILLGTFPVIGGGNYFIADKEITSPYVWGSIVLGPVFKLGNIALNKSVDKVLQNRIEEHFMTKFSNEENDT